MHWLISIILLAAPLAAQTVPPVRLELKCGKSPCTFRMGEVIPLELSFTSTVPKRYEINMASYDRSGRMNYETFRVTPTEGTSDPLQTYFAFGGFMGGGLTTIKFLDTEPVPIKLTLNEWVRFDQPGTHRLQLTSTRVSDATRSSHEIATLSGLTSNEIELEIVAADSDWQQHELQRIVQTLDDPKHANESLTALRYLGTGDAARELAKRLGTADPFTEFQYMFGLIGSPHADAGLAEMSVLLRDPDFPVTSTFLRTMAYLTLGNGDAPQKQFDQSMENNRVALVAALASKRGKALAVSAETALEDVSANAPESLRKTLSQQLQRNFGELAPDKQANWLQYRWGEIKDPSWIPVLRQIATAYEDFSEPREMHAYQSLQASGAALKRWYELDPEEARRAVIAEIVRPKPRYGAEILGMLKDESLPEVEAALMAALGQTDNYQIESHILALLERYGTGAAIGEIVSSKGYLVGKWACEPQDHFLGYVLKFDPQTARPLVERAIEARSQESNGCRRTLFTDLGAKHAGPLLEELAIKGLNNPDPEVAFVVSYK